MSGIGFLPIKDHWDNFLDREKWEMGTPWNLVVSQLVKLSLFGHRK